MVSRVGKHVHSHARATALPHISWGMRKLYASNPMTLHHSCAGHSRLPYAGRLLLHAALGLVTVLVVLNVVAPLCPVNEGTVCWIATHASQSCARAFRQVSDSASWRSAGGVPSHQPTIAVCAVMQHEHPDDVLEWVEYHRCVQWCNAARCMLMIQHHAALRRSVTSCW